MENDERQQFENVLAALLANPALAEFHAQIREFEVELRADPEPLHTIMQREGPVDLLVQLQLAGYLDEEQQLQQLPAPAIVEDYSLFPPSPERELELSRLPDLATRLETIREIIQAKAVGKGSAQDRQNVTTFIFLHDPQPSRVDGQNDENPRIKALSQLNSCLNGLEGTKWPTGFHLHCEGQTVGPIAGIFFAGDLSQAGGDYDWIDQFIHEPPSFKGGWEVAMTRYLFQKDFSYRSSAVKTRYANAYFGLGNHDIQTEYAPKVGWWWRWAGCNSWQAFSEPADYNRYQMWNFICQAHTGVWGRKTHVTPVTAIDGTGDASAYCWKSHSLNYCVNLGPVDVFQMHVYGGDSENGREDGIAWLKNQLAQRDISRPIIIVQHYAFDSVSDKQPNWTRAQRDAFLRILEPYNVIALLTGHVHNPGNFPDGIQIPNSTKYFMQFRPGMCSDFGGFALARVSDSSFDILQGSTKTGAITWVKGYSQNISNTTNASTRVLEGNIMPVTFISWTAEHVVPSRSSRGYLLGDFSVVSGQTYRISAVFDYLAQGDTPPPEFPGIAYHLSCVINGAVGPQIPGGILSGGTAWMWVKGAIMGLFTSSATGLCELYMVIEAPSISGTGAIHDFKLTVEVFQPPSQESQIAS